MGYVEPQGGQIVYVMPGGWITGDEATAMRAWHNHNHMRDPGTVPRFDLFPPSRRYRGEAISGHASSSTGTM